MEYTTVKGVPLLRTGTWNGSTGGTTPITKADLSDIVEAAQDGDLDPAIIKIGHADSRFPAVTEDGEPAYGSLSNVRLSDDGETLLADFENVPVELAQKLSSAYPHRSVELRSRVSLMDAAGKVVKKFKRVLTAVALLGATPPAVKGLGSVHAAFSHGDEVEDAGEPEVLLFRLGNPLTVEQTRQALARAIGDAAAVVDFTDRLVWYRRAVPSPEGGAAVRHFQQAYTESDGKIELTGDAVEAVPQSATTFVPMNSAGDTAYVPPPSVLDEQSGTNLPTSERESAVATLADLFNAFGATIPESADYTDIELPDEAIELLTAAFEAKGRAEAEAAETAQAEAAALSERLTGTVQVSEAQFSELTASNTAMRAELDQLHAERASARRDAVIETALSEGRLHPSEREAWRKALDDAEETATTLLSQMKPVAGMSELGSSAAPAATSLSEAREEAINKAEARIFGEDD